MAMLTPVKSMTLVEQANEQLLQLIARESLQAGDSLPSIGALAEQLGASKAVIRESFRNLEARGIIDVANGRRARIKPVTSAPLVDFFSRFMQVETRALEEFTEIRVALELQCVHMAIERGTDTQLQALSATLVAMREQLMVPEKFAELDMRFHLQIAEATQNTLMVHLLESLRDAISNCIREGLHRKPSRPQMEKVMQAHEQLAVHIIARSSDAAKRALHTHFNETSLIHD